MANPIVKLFCGAKTRWFFVGLLALWLVVQSVLFLRSIERAATEAERRRDAAAAGEEVHLHGSPRKKHSKGPRIAILSLSSLSKYQGPRNVKAYAQKWDYDYVEAFSAVQSAASALRRWDGDLLFLKIFSLMRFLPRYDWIFWHDTDSIFLNHSRPLTEFIDEHYDMVLTAAACGSGKSERLLDTGHMLVRNSPTALTTLRSVWSLWNHTHCKYGEDQYVGGQSLCKVAGGRARYYQGELGALMSVLGHCEPCDKKVKYTGFRTFNSMYPCHGPGDLLVHMPRLVGAGGEAKRKEVMEEFMKKTDFATGVYELGGLLSPPCPESERAHQCRDRISCDRMYHGLNAHRRCPPSAETVRARRAQNATGPPLAGGAGSGPPLTGPGAHARGGPGARLSPGETNLPRKPPREVTKREKKPPAGRLPKRPPPPGSKPPPFLQQKPGRGDGDGGSRSVPVPGHPKPHALPP